MMGGTVPLKLVNQSLKRTAVARYLLRAAAPARIGKEACMTEIDRFLRNREVGERTGLSRTTRWRLERDGKFPKRRQISPNSVAWLESEIRSWMEARKAPEVAAE